MKKFSIIGLILVLVCLWILANINHYEVENLKTHIVLLEGK